MTNTKVNQFLPINFTKNQTSIHILLIKKVTKTSMQVYNSQCKYITVQNQLAFQYSQIKIGITK